MIRYPSRVRRLAPFLCALAGFVDAVGFIELGGFFVSFMSGNSTRLGVSLAEGSPQAAAAAGLLAIFVAGVVAGSVVGRAAAAGRRPAVLALVSALLALAAVASTYGAATLAAAGMALAMGAENAVFEDDGELRIGLTYMTGTLVKLGQRLAAALMGGDRWAWTPYAMLWLGLSAGGLAGALVHAHLGAGALWIAAVISAVLAVAAAALGPDHR